MLTDPFGRRITYLRVSVTDRCNFRCIYCMGEEGVQLKSHTDILSYEQIVEIVTVASSLGVTKVRLTGGEPLVRRDVEVLVRQVAETPGIAETCMTSNGSLLTMKKALALKAAGLSRINISLDSLDPKRFLAITRCGNFDDVLRGIDAALEADLTPVKINMVLLKDTTEEEVVRMREFCRKKGVFLQTIQSFRLDQPREMTTISADRPPPCERCHRLRLTSDGFLKPCLFSDLEIPVDFHDIQGSIRTAVEQKPETGLICVQRTMSQIGG